MRPLLKVVAGLDLRPGARSLAEARRIARPVLREWLRRVEHHVLAGRLAPLDLMMAKELTNCGPSANEGHCYSGQERLGKAIGSCARTARSSLKRLCSTGLLDSKRRGPGRTASWTFCVNKVPIFGGAERKVAAQDRQHLSGLDRQHVADKPSDSDPIERNPPPTPNESAERAAPPKGATEEASAAALDGEILDGTISFEEFWLAAGKIGSEGAARGRWRSLDDADKAAIAGLLSRDGRLRVRGMWAATWLRDRLWNEPTPVASDTPDFGGSRGPTVTAEPNSDLWRAERARLVAINDLDKLKWMDAQAARGLGVTVRQ